MMQPSTDRDQKTSSHSEVEHDHHPHLFLNLSASLITVLTSIFIVAYDGNEAFKASVWLALDVALKSHVVVEIRSQW